jgi:dolichyl-phosphate-mannose-protein mannosyltransferase
VNSSPLAAGDRESWFSWLNFALILLFIACIARLWLMPLGSSFWVDELLTAFIVRYGSGHPSLTVAPQVVASNYYALPRISAGILGASEIAYRLPSVLAMGLALWFIGRLAARLIHPRAGWFAAFACLALSGINYHAVDARPYALGICIAAASFFFLARWMDSARLIDAAGFIICAALLWRVHLIYWPLYVTFFAYAVYRVLRRSTPVKPLHAAAGFVLLGLALLPVLRDTLAILPRAQEHAFASMPQYRELFNSFKWGLVASCAAIGCLVDYRLLKSGRPQAPEATAAHGATSPGSVVLIAGWWLLPPVLLFAYSRFSGNSVFLYRYLSISLPGAVLAAVFGASLFLPATYWRRAALALGLAVFLLMGQWTVPWPHHDLSDWRDAAQQLYSLRLAPETPVICPSPFLEARPPAWSPQYQLPGFLYAHLNFYPIPGKPILLPFEASSEAYQYATDVTREMLATTDRFAIYGGDRNVENWRDWFVGQPELAGWHETSYDRFGNVGVVLFERHPVYAAK